MPQYNLQLSPSAKRGYEQLPHDAQSRLKEVLESVAQCEQISSHSKCSRLSNEQGAYKVKVGEYRAIATLQKPNLQILKVGHRQGFYEKVENLYAEL